MSHVTINPKPAYEHDTGCPATVAPHCFKGAPPAPTRHFRVTRPERYPAPGCPGQDPAGRQGYYTDACCATKAARIIARRLVTDVNADVEKERLDVQVWR